MNLSKDIQDFYSENNKTFLGEIKEKHINGKTNTILMDYNTKIDLKNYLFSLK
jgi:hypothetical protein